MEFQPQKVEEFVDFFNERREKILAFEGCQHVELLVDDRLANVYYTLSHWNDADALENYRQSAFFGKTWTATKMMFEGKPRAYSLVRP